nr:unnamed protein product [Callosobruchus chinensis]
MRKHCGLEYRTKKKVIVAKTIKPPCTGSCKLKCKSKISEQKRQDIHSFGVHKSHLRQGVKLLHQMWNRSHYRDVENELAREAVSDSV